MLFSRAAKTKNVFCSKRQVAILSTPTATQSKCQRAHPKFDAHGACWARHEPTLTVTVSEYFLTLVTLNIFQCAQSLEFYAVCNNAVALSQTLRAHARNITGRLLSKSKRQLLSDIDWCWHAPLLVSCALDEPVAVWDTREGLNTLSHATILLPAIGNRYGVVMLNLLFLQLVQIKHVGRLSPSTCLPPHMTATSKSGTFGQVFACWSSMQLFVLQRPGAPQQYLSAHVAKVHSLEWSPTNEHTLATAAVDGIKLWRLNATQKRADSATRAAAWKIRYMHVEAKCIEKRPFSGSHHVVAV